MINRTKLACGIISFNPDNSIIKNTSGIIWQVDLCIIIDNNSNINNKKYIEHLRAKFGNKVIIIENAINEGIAFALNQALTLAYENECDWLITLDQDSIVPKYYRDILEAQIQQDRNQKVVSYAPKIYDSRNGQLLFPKRDKKRLMWCITSGNAINVKSIYSIGGFNASFFIDSVDFDLCLRIIKAGYSIGLLKKCIVMHSLGEQKVIKINKRQYYINCHNIFREYYMIRNNLLLSKKYFLTFPLLIIKKNISLFKDLVISVAINNKKSMMLKIYCKALWDGLRNKYLFTGVYSKPNGQVHYRK
jgi:rhamnosyltransferase